MVTVRSGFQAGIHNVDTYRRQKLLFSISIISIILIILIIAVTAAARYPELIFGCALLCVYCAGLYTDMVMGYAALPQNMLDSLSEQACTHPAAVNGIQALSARIVRHFHRRDHVTQISGDNRANAS
ncbi:hypothetical protein PSPO01_08367 [Paraphaeosphaeria sporulosa]